MAVATDGDPAVSAVDGCCEGEGGGEEEHTDVGAADRGFGAFATALRVLLSRALARAPMVYVCECVCECVRVVCMTVALVSLLERRRVWYAK
jgi:hypothetical protein